MIVETTAIPDVKLLTPRRFPDGRGFFSETWNQGRFVEAGVSGPFVQDNHAMSVDRGLYLQIAPSAQGKLIRVADTTRTSPPVHWRAGPSELYPHRLTSNAGCGPCMHTSDPCTTLACRDPARSGKA
jgi:dTDP-4-dehydrorhamnose 3,5-epimerase-like enzyme